MAGAASWKGAVKVGPVLQFPIKARTAISESTFTFNMHHRACGSRLRQGNMTCEGCGTVLERGTSDIIKGYDGYVGEPDADGNFPGVDEDYIKSLARERSVVMETEGFVPAAQVDPRWFQKSYNVSPDKGGEQAYVLVLRLMERNNVVLFGRINMSNKEFLVVLRPRDGVMSMEALYWPDELRNDLETRELISGIKIAPKLLKQGDALVKSLTTDFQPSTLTNEYATEVAEYLEAYKAGTAPVPVAAVSRPAPKMADLESMLEASLAGVQSKPKARKTKAA